MFKFLQRAFRRAEPDRAPLILAECEKESQRTAKALPQFMSNPRDVNLRTSLLQKAADAGLTEHQTVKGLAFLHHLIEFLTVDPTPPLEMLEPLVEEAKRYQFEDIHAVRMLRDHLKLTR